MTNSALKYLVLVVDNEPLVREYLGDVLRTHGFTVETAHGGTAALLAFEERSHNLILLDVAMPATDGWETLDLLHGTGLQPNVLMMSGVPDEARAASAGAAGFIGKPYSPRGVIAAVEAALGCVGSDIGEPHAP